MKDTAYKTAIDEMRARKKELGYTYKELADLSGVPLPTVQKILGGFTKSPRYENVLAIKKALWPAGLPDTPGEDGRRPGLPAEKGILPDAPAEYNDPSGKTGLYAEMTGETLRGQGFAAESPAPYYTDPKKAGAAHVYSESFTAARRSGQTPVTSYPLLPHKRQGEYTARDREMLPGDVRTELIDGVIYDLAAPKSIHQIIVGEIFNQIYNQIEKCGKDCLVFTAPSDVWLTGDDRNIFQPDLYVICDLNMIDPDGWTRGAPPFVVEVLSPSTRSRDILLKAFKYHAAGVHEYWIVDPERKRILVYDYDRDPDGTVYTEYSFDDVVPIGFSGGGCSVDFKRAAAILNRIGWQRS